MKSLNFPRIVCFLAAVVLLTVGIIVYAQQINEQNNKGEMSCPMTEKHAGKDKSHEDCPMMKKKEAQASEVSASNQSHSDHHKMVMENGEKAMGFSQTATTHHFLMMKDGGAIEVEANDAKDFENRNKIREHLTEITKQFQKGIFTTPFAVHGQVPPGVAEMEQLKNEIRYAYEETEKGARVRISTGNSKALAAIHSFLKFQIEDHQTDDPKSIVN